MIELFRTRMEIKQRNNHAHTVDILAPYENILTMFKTTISVEIQNVARGEQEQNGYKKHVEMRGTN